MAQERIIKILEVKGDTSDADKKVNKLKKDVDSLGESTEKVNEQTQQGVESVGKSAQKTNKSVGFLTGGFKKLGFAIKATGIGIFVGLIAGLGNAFSQNQRFMDAFNTVTETMGIILSEVVTALMNVYDSVSSNSENFNALGKVLKGVLTLSITPLKLAFLGIKLAIQQSQLAWEKSFLGGNDKDKIKQLTLDVLDTKQAIIDTGKDAVESGKNIITNFGEAITETSNIAKKTVEEVGKISVESAIKTAKANVEIRNTAKLAVAEQQRLVEIYDRQAEQQRQIRDEERNSIQERIEANDKLGKVLQEQEKAMLRQADAQIASAKADLDKNNNIENQVALTEALANKEGVLAQIEGFRSEQLVNDLQLKREQIELDNTISDAEKERRLAQLAFDEEQELNEIAKLDKQKERLELENEIILEDLERKRELFKLGTQARVDAEQEYLTKKQEIDNQIKITDKKRADEQIKLEQSVKQAKSNILNQGFQLLIELAGRGSKIGKALAATNVIRSGIEGVQNAYTTAQKSPITAVFPAYPTIQAGLAGAFSALQLRQILSSSDTVSTSGGTTQSQPSAPSFNLIQGTGANQITQAVNNDNAQPVKALVVSSDVTSSQQYDRQKLRSSSI